MTRSYRNSERIPPIMQGRPVAREWRVPGADWDRPPWNHSNTMRAIDAIAAELC